MAAEQITQGAIDAMFNDPERANSRFPVPILQCLQIKTLEAKAATAGAAERYRVVLSDTQNYVQSMLATQVNHVVHDGLLQRGSIVRLKQYQANSVKGKNIMIVLDLEVIESLGAPDKIGEPTNVELKQSNGNTTIGGAGFYGAKTETQESKPAIQKPAPSRGGPGNATIYPIEGLSPYAHKWTIKARVTSKSDIRTWNKPSGEGKLFSVNLLDETGEIKMTGFNEQCDAFYDVLQEGSVYYISSPCKVGFAKKQFSNLANEYELVMERDIKIEKAEDQTAVPQVRFNFCNIQELQDVEKDATVDVIGVLREAEDVTQIVSKSTGKPYDKRELTLVDDTGFSVRATVWGKTANGFDAKPESVIAFKGMRVGDFGGRSLSLLSSGTMTVDPDIPEAHKLKGWYDASGRNNSFATHTGLAGMGGATGRKDEIKDIRQVEEESLGMENMVHYTLKATVVYIMQKNFAYPACISEGCSKKVADMEDGTWRCEKCQITHPRAEYRYNMSISVSDHTGQMYLSCFDDVAKIIMGGKPAGELIELRENGEDARLTAEFTAVNCRKMNFTVRAKMDTFDNTQRIRHQAVAATPLDYKSEANRLADLVKQMSV